MKSKNHLLFNLTMLKPVMVLIYYTAGYSVLALFGFWLYSNLLAVFIDLDHFLIARIKDGDWDRFWHYARRPHEAFGNQEEVFEDLDHIAEARKLTHMLLFMPLVFTTLLIDYGLFLITLFTLWLHITLDVYKDWIIKKKGG